MFIDKFMSTQHEQHGVCAKFDFDSIVMRKKTDAYLIKLDIQLKFCKQDINKA